MFYGKVTRYTHYFAVIAYEPKLRLALREYMGMFEEKELRRIQGRFRNVPKRMWCRRSLRNGVRAFSINDWPNFIKVLDQHGLSESDLDITTVEPSDGKSVELKVRDGYTPWDDQIPLVQHGKEIAPQYAVTLQPGGGKTAIAMFLAEFFGKRFAVITKGGYEGRWVPAFYEYLELTPDEVRSCCGAKAIANLIKEAKKHGIDQVKAIFISTGGFRDYIKKYEDGHYDGTHCEDVPPEKLLDFLEVGFRITDEAHQDIHLNFLVDLYTNMKRTLYLTGTLYPTVEFMRRIYEMYLPLEIRKTTKFKVYAEAVEVFYYLNDPDSAKYTDSQGSYNHIIFEQWLMKDEKRLKNWLDAYYDYVVATWASNRVEETKIITFAATIELNGKMAEYFKKRMSDMRVVQYKAGDPYDYLIDNDMIFATLGKAGTAVDIPDLEQVNMTHAVDAPNTFVQAFGRLRDLKKYPKLTPSFHWFTCGNIDKQREYGDRKRKVLRPRVKGFRTAHLNKKI